VWDLLEINYGQTIKTEVMGIIEIRGAEFIFRAALTSKSITVIRTKNCTEKDVTRLHSLIGFDEKSTFDHFPLEAL